MFTSRKLLVRIQPLEQYKFGQVVLMVKPSAVNRKDVSSNLTLSAGHFFVLFDIFIYKQYIMPRKQKTIHYLYKTTCNITSRWYIGMHSTNNLDDGYLGSGIRLRRSIRKYGESNHTKEILEFFDTRDLLVEAEKNVITEDMILDVNCMNLMSGGTGGFISVEQQRHRSSCAVKARIKKGNEDPEWFKKYKAKMSLATKKAIKDGKVLTWKETYDRTGKKHSEETKKKMSDSSKGKGKGKTNSQYGSCWITNEKENRKIKRGDSIPEGFRLGRKMKV